MPTLRINGVEVVTTGPMTILEAAMSAGIEIPHYCYHPGLSIVGQCRLCQVEVEKMPVKGFLAHCVNYLGETGESTMSTSVRGYKGNGVSVYIMSTEGEADEDGHEHGDDDEPESVEPFLEFP